MSVFFLLVWCAPVLANNALMRISVCYEHWFPYAYTDNTKVSQGAVISRLKAPLENHTLAFEFREMPHVRCAKAVEEGAVDFGLFFDKEDGLQVIELPIAYWELLLVTQKSRPLKSLEAFKGDGFKRVLVASGYSYPQGVLAQLRRYQKELVQTSYYTPNDFEVKSLFRFLEQGYVDAMLLDKQWAQRVTRLNELNIHLPNWLLHREPQYVAYQHASAEKVAVIRMLLQAYE